MQLTSLSAIKSLLKKYNIHPRKYLGQNFLISRNVLEKIIGAAELSKEDTVLEIGPGIGVLTLELAKKAKKVIAIEKDLEMVKIVKDVLTVLSVENVEIIEGNILKIPNSPTRLASQREAGRQFSISNYKVVANIPYYITSPVIRMFLESENKPESMVLMVQKEVAQRICAKPRTRASTVRGMPPKMSLLSVSVQFYAEPKIISYVSKKCFWPRPKVDSAILKISPFDFVQGKRMGANLPRIDTNLFFEIVKAGFSSKRKFLANNLSRLCQGFHLRPSGFGGQVGGQARVLKNDKKDIEKILIQTGINPKSRAENLNIKDWVRIYEEIIK